jgi:penicillin-binding protein 1C
MKDVFMFLISALLLTSTITLLWLASFELPDLKSFRERRVAESTKIYDRTGKILLYDINEGVRRTIVSGDKINRNIKNAIVAIEDGEFYEHYGIRPKAIARAIYANFITGEKSQGGSTITQQVIKSTVLTKDKTYSRKIKEWILAIKLERELSKDEILELYLNEAPYGGNIYGVEEAARDFFGKTADTVTLAEAAYLASIPNAPTFYSPYGQNKKALDDRKDLVLSEMLRRGFISETEHDIAKGQKVVFKEQDSFGIKAPHFVFYVQEELERRFGRDAVEFGGLTVITTLDYSLQQEAEKIVREQALKNALDGVSNAAAIVLDPKTGDILSMVGSRDYFDKIIDGNVNVTTALRQPGSTFKPFVYAKAFEKGYTPETILYDVETEFSLSCNPDSTPKPGVSPDTCYNPQNYDGNFSGPLEAKRALAQSRNIPAIKALYLAGIPESLRLAQDMGISTLNDPNRYGLSLVLGGGEVKLIDMTTAYGVFANEGTYIPHRSILRVVSSSNEITYEPTVRGNQVLSENIALVISNILSTDAYRQPVFAPYSLLHIPGRDVAVKTGTTNNFRDFWAVGYTPQVVVGIWAGNNVASGTIPANIASRIAGPIWNPLMKKVLETYPAERFKTPTTLVNASLPPVLRGFGLGGKTYTIDTISGKLATDLTPPETREERVITDPHSILYWIDKDNPHTLLTSSSTDPQLEYWEYGVRKWAQQRGISQNPNVVIPTEYDPIHTEANKPSLVVNRPSNSEKFSKDSTLFVSIAVGTKSSYRHTKTDIFFNGAFVGSFDGNQTQFPLNLRDLNTQVGENVIKIEVADSVYNKNQAEVRILVEN